MPVRLFDAVREEATAYGVAVNYGLRPNRAKMICCPFHQDKHPSMNGKSKNKRTKSKR